jgi:hypothetical protein
MAMMDTTVSGCVASAIEGPLDEWRREVLTARTRILAEVLPIFSDDAYATKYFSHLRAMAVLAAELDDTQARHPQPQPLDTPSGYASG